MVNAKKYFTVKSVKAREIKVGWIVIRCIAENITCQKPLPSGIVYCLQKTHIYRNITCYQLDKCGIITTYSKEFETNPVRLIKVIQL